MDHTLLRKQAKAAVQAGWIMLAIGTLVYVALEGLCSFLPILTLVLAGPLSYGYYKYVSRQVDEGRTDFNDLFAGFSGRFIDTMVAGLVVSLVICVGLILLIVPGIIAALGLSQVYFILLDDPTASATDAIKRSWQLMNGHKVDFFIFILGFIGWLLLGIITFGILMLYVEPYMTAAQLNYYRAIKSIPPDYNA